MARKTEWSKDVWKLIAILALAAAIIQACVGVYAVLAFKSNMDIITASAPVCYGSMKNFDSIAAAQAIGRLDLVSFLLTTGGILLGAFSLIGFWVIRREAMEEARDAALEEVKRVLPLMGLDENKNGTYKNDSGVPRPRAKKQLGSKSSAPKPSDPSRVSTAGAVLEQPGEPDDDAQRGV